VTRGTKRKPRPAVKRKPARRPRPKKLKLVTTTMEMRAPQHRNSALPLGIKVALLRAETPTVSFYRYLYDTIGAPVFWCERRRLGDRAIAALIADPKIEIYVLYCGGVPAGFAELDLRQDDDVELAHFGLIPDFLNPGLADYLLGWVVDEAWRRAPARVWLRTTNFDHPTVLAAYQKAGFGVVGQETRQIDDPRATGVLPKDIAVPHAALAE
jgi:GNAT superfamily N-acetyltransferase